MSYMTISSQENHHFSLCSYFHAHPTTLLLKILGDQCMGRPHLKFLGGPSPQSPLGLRPCLYTFFNNIIFIPVDNFTRWGIEMAYPRILHTSIFHPGDSLIHSSRTPALRSEEQWKTKM